MSDIRCPSCKLLLGRRTLDGSVELRERGKLVALVRWGRLGCPRCGSNSVQDVVPSNPVGVDINEVKGPATKQGG